MLVIRGDAKTETNPLPEKESGSFGAGSGGWLLCPGKRPTTRRSSVESPITFFHFSEQRGCPMYNFPHQQIVGSPANDCNSVIICPGVIISCITIYSPVLSAPQEGYNELQRVTMGYKPLWGKQPDHQHVSDFHELLMLVSVAESDKSGSVGCIYLYWLCHCPVPGRPSKLQLEQRRRVSPSP